MEFRQLSLEEGESSMDTNTTTANSEENDLNNSEENDLNNKL